MFIFTVLLQSLTQSFEIRSPELCIKSDQTSLHTWQFARPLIRIRLVSLTRKRHDLLMVLFAAALAVKSQANTLSLTEKLITTMRSSATHPWENLSVHEAPKDTNRPALCSVINRAHIWPHLKWNWNYGLRHHWWAYAGEHSGRYEAVGISSAICFSLTHGK